jgi:hypothetical protein
MSNSTLDLNGCLRNCSNRGLCPFNPQTQTFMCICNEHYTGLACQHDTRPCSINGQCLHQGLCSSNANLTNTIISSAYQCKCVGNFTGTNCENYLNVCESEKCSSQGFCYANENTNEWTCKCYAEYSGNTCEIANGLTLKIIKYAKTSSLVVLLSVIGTFVFIIVVNDVSSFFCSKQKVIRRKYTISNRVKRFKYFN